MKMKTELLAMLATLLEEDARNPTGMKFDLQTIAMPSGASILWEPGVSCATTGCALGLAALSKQFPGLSYTLRAKNMHLMVDGREMFYSDAAAKYFSISEDEAYKLFSPVCYGVNQSRGIVGELAVAARIRRLIQDGNLDETDHRTVEVIDYVDAYHEGTD